MEASSNGTLRVHAGSRTNESFAILHLRQNNQTLVSSVHDRMKLIKCECFIGVVLSFVAINDLVSIALLAHADL